MKGPFRAIVIIDDLSDRLETVLTERLKFPVEVLTVRPYEDDQGARQYVFDAFLADVRADIGETKSSSSTKPLLTVEDIDDIVVPAREDGFNAVFLGEDAWQSVRIHSSMLPQIKYCAAYQVAPISAITYIAKVKEIVPSTYEPAKYRLLFEEAATPIGPIRLQPGGHITAPRSARYTTRARLEAAKTLDDVWAQPAVPV